MANEEVIDQHQSAGRERLSTSQLCRPIYKARFWIFGVGLMTFIAGVIILFYAFSAVMADWKLFPYIIIGAVCLWQGILLISSVRAISHAYSYNNDYALVAGLARLRNWFIILGLTILVQVLLDMTVYVIRKFAD